MRLAKLSMILSLTTTISHASFKPPENSKLHSRVDKKGGGALIVIYSEANGPYLEECAPGTLPSSHCSTMLTAVKLEFSVVCRLNSQVHFQDSRLLTHDCNRGEIKLTNQCYAHGWSQGIVTSSEQWQKVDC
jgi:hypothetical protein